MKYKFQQINRNKKGKFGRSIKRHLVSFVQKLLALSFLALDLLIIAPQDLYYDSKLFVKDLEKYIDLSLSSIEVEGNDKVSKEDIIALSNLKTGENILHLDLNQIKKNIESNNWIADAVVERIYPSQVKITVEEEKAKAIYIRNQKTYFINYMGKIIEEVNDDNASRNFLYLIGDGANESYASVLDDLYASDVLYQNIEGLVKINNRRWDVKLKNNITLKLPEHDLIKNLAIFDGILEKNNLLDYPCVIDLRLLPDKIYIKF